MFFLLCGSLSAIYVDEIPETPATDCRTHTGIFSSCDIPCSFRFFSLYLSFCFVIHFFRHRSVSKRGTAFSHRKLFFLSFCVLFFQKVEA